MNKFSEVFRTNYNKVFWILISLVLFLFAWQKQRWDGDIFWALEAGKWILENGEVPKVDLFSHTFSGEKWIDFTWGFQVLLFTFFNYFGGWYGIFLLHFVLTLTFIILYFNLLSCELNNKKYLVMFLVAMSLPVFLPRLFMRPHIAEFIFVAAFMLLLSLYSKSKDNRYVWPLLVLQVLWINFHSSFILGYFLCGVWSMGLVIDDLISQKFSFEVFKRSCNQYRNLIFVSFLLPVVSILNPYGFELVYYPFVHQSFYNHEALKYIQEWASLDFMNTMTIIDFSNPLQVTFVFLIYFFIYNTFKNYRIIKPYYFFVFLAASYLAFNYSRFAPLFVLFVVPALAQAFLKYYDNFTPVRFKKDIIFLLLTTVTIIGVGVNKLYKQNFDYLGVGIIKEYFPEGSVAYLNTNNIEGNLFNGYLEGGYFINNYSGGKVVIDGRTPTVYSGNFYWKFRLASSAVKWDKFSEENNIEIAVPRNSTKVCDYLIKDINWVPVFYDDTSVVFLKNIDKYKRHIENSPFKKFTPCKSSVTTLISNSDPGILKDIFNENVEFINSLDSLDMTDRLVYPYRYIAAIADKLDEDFLLKGLDYVDYGLTVAGSSDSKPYLLILKASILNKLGKVLEALEIYEYLIYKHSDINSVLRSSAVFYFNNGNFDRSQELIYRYIDKVGHNAEFEDYKVLGRSCFNLEDYECSSWALERAAYLADDSEVVDLENIYLSISLNEMDKSELAVKVLNSVLLDSPDFLIKIQEIIDSLISADEDLKADKLRILLQSTQDYMSE